MPRYSLFLIALLLPLATATSARGDDQTTPTSRPFRSQAIAGYAYAFRAPADWRLVDVSQTSMTIAAPHKNSRSPHVRVTVVGYRPPKTALAKHGWSPEGELGLDELTARMAHQDDWFRDQ